MFGGLSLKGESKEEACGPAAGAAAPAAGSSGFSFLQSSIGAPTAPDPATAAAADPMVPSPSTAPVAPGDNAAVLVQPQAAASLSSSAMGSAFGFMSGASSAASSIGQAEEASASTSTSAPNAAPTPPPASIFAGLNAAHSVAKEPSAASGSGFSFLSAPAQPAVADGSAGNASAASASSTAGSSFRFMNSMVNDIVGGNSDRGEAAARSCPASVEENEEGAVTASTAAGGMSGFSFLSEGPAAALAPAPPPCATGSAPPSVSESSRPAAASSAPAPGDLLSLSNPGLPAGSGVSWSAPTMGGTGAKRVVKKKRGKRVGVGSAAVSGSSQPKSIPDPEQPPPSFQPPMVPGSSRPPPPATAPDAPQTPMASLQPDSLSPMTSPPYKPATMGPVPPMPSSPKPHGIEQAGSTPVRIKAERAMDKADEFIREKQRKSAIAMAAERAMQERSGSGPMQRSPSESSDGGWKTSNSLEEPRSPTDETYMAAKAAAEEARKIDHQPKLKGKKGSLFGNFFQRGKGGSGSSTHGITSLSSHGGVVGGSGTVQTTHQRGGSGGSTSGGTDPRRSPLPSPLLSTNETLDVGSYGAPLSTDGDQSGSTEQGQSKQQLDRIRQEREEKQKEVELQEAERRRREAEAEKLRKEIEKKQKEERERLEQQRREEEERRRSPRQKMQAVLDHLAEATRKSADAVVLLRQRRVKLVAEKGEAEKAERYAAQKLKFAEAQQTLAVEAEDFEAADQLGAEIEKHSKEKEEQSMVCSKMADSISKVDEEKELASRGVSACFAAARVKLQELEKEVDDRAKEESVLDQFEKTSKRLSNETERLANDLKHIVRDESVLAEEQKELGGQISEEIKEFEEKSSQSSTKLEEVNEKMDSLRKQLAEAEAEASDLSAEIFQYKQSIQNVKSKYSRQLGRLEKKEKSVKESRADWESEKESIEKAQKAHEAVVAAHSEDMLSREKLIEDIKAESSAAKDMEDIVSGAFVDTALNGECTTLESVDSDVLKYEAAVNEANKNVLSAETNIENLKEELSAIEVRVPILEMEKKMAASKRDFKAAGKASKTIKDLSGRKEQCQAQLAGEAMEQKQFAKEELGKITVLLEEKKSIAAEKGKEVGLKQIEALKGKIKELKTMLEKFSLADESEQDDTVHVFCVGAFVIQSQISFLETEGKALGEKFGGWQIDLVEDSSVHSAPTFDSAEECMKDVVINKGVLEKYISLRSELQELEVAVKEAAEAEEFDKAAELEELIQSVREEFEASGFSSTKFEQALKNFNSKSSDAAGAGRGNANEDSPKKVIGAGILEKYTSLSAQLKEWEAGVDDAVAKEDYDIAAELEENIQSARSDIELLGFSIDALEEALKNRHGTSSNKEGAGAGESDEKKAADLSDGDDKEDVCRETHAGDDDLKVNGESHGLKEKEDTADNTEAPPPTTPIIVVEGLDDEDS